MEDSNTLESESSINFFNLISSDLTQLILSHLPIRSIIRCSAVCKLWHSITTEPAFITGAGAGAVASPWFFLYGRNNIFVKKNQAFAFDPDANEWIKLPTNFFPPSLSSESSITGSGGFFFNTAANNFSFSPILKPLWRETNPLRFSRLNPLIGVINSGFDSNSSLPTIIVVAGVRFIGGLVDIEDNLSVEIYNPYLDSWDLCPPLPADFRSNSSQSLSSALFNSKFYVLGMHSGFISSFDLNNRVWSEVQTLRPPGVIISFLISCRNQLMLAGICNNRHGPSFNLWRIDELTSEFSEVAIMPRDLLDCLFDVDDDDDPFASVKCVGFGDFVFVFNEEHRRNYPACVCEVLSDAGGCRWRRVPDLPEPVNRFHKVIGFCSTVSFNRM